MVFEHFELKGERALRYAFEIIDPEKGKSKYRISLGSYEPTTQFARETGQIGKNERMYHLDGYYPDGVHATFGFFTKEPSYEDTRKSVIAILQGKKQPTSSSKPK